MISTLCLSFVAASATPPPVPTSVRQIAEMRVKQQFEAVHPDMQFSFDDPNCPNHGQYVYTSESLRLSAEHAMWPGTREYGLSDLIEGRKLDFPLPDAPRPPDWSAKGPTPNEASRPVVKFLTGALIGGTGGAWGGMALSPNRASRNLNGIVFGLAGAVTGGLLSFSW